MQDLVRTGRTPEQWSEALMERGIKLSPRTLRQKARKHGQFYAMGRLMLIMPYHIEAMLKAETSVANGAGRGG